MSDDDGAVGKDRILVAQRWVVVAERDIRSAYACLDAHEPIPETAAYLCQQSVEKLIKSPLVLVQVPFRKTHDLEALRDLVVPHFPDLRSMVDQLVPLTDWGHVFRYPDMSDDPVPSPDELRAVLRTIREFGNQVVERIEAAPPRAGKATG